MHKLTLLLILFVTPILAATEDQRTCSVFSSWVNAVALHRAQGVPKKDVIYSLEQQGTVEEDFKPTLQIIIDWIYAPEFPPIENGQDIASITYGAYARCLQTKREQDKKI